MNDLDRILRTEPTLSPPPGFVGGVMATVHRRAEEPPPIAFPWRSAAVGFGAGALLIVAAAIAALSQPPGGGSPAGLLPGFVARAMGALPRDVLAPLALALVASLAAVRLSFRMAGSRD